MRIAMTVAEAGERPGELRLATAEEPHDDGSSLVTFAVQSGRIAADLTTGADVAGAVALKANEGMSCPGVQLMGDGFILTTEEALNLGLGTVPDIERHIRPYRNGRDLTDSPRGVFVIDLFGLSAEEVRQRLPAVYQHVLTTVKPVRETNNRASYREKWWIFGEPVKTTRDALRGLLRYIATVKTAKHRTFQFLDATILPDSKLISFASDDALILGILSSRIHCVWALAAGSWLGYGNDPTYVKSASFEKFPFPACDEGAKARIRALGEELDAHRKRVQAQHPGLSLTAMYNVLEKLRAAARSGRACSPSAPGEDVTTKCALGESALPLTPKEQATHDAGLVSVLRQLHDELDAAVATAYGWVRAGRAETDLSDAEILTRLVALNAERAAEETAGRIRWLRPDYQAPRGTTTQTGLEITTKDTKSTKAKASKTKEPWPNPLAERVAAVERALAAAAAPATPAQLAKHFHRAKPEDLAEILETLATLGRAHRDGEKFSL